jgi:hypothetical protein
VLTETDSLHSFNLLEFSFPRSGVSQTDHRQDLSKPPDRQFVAALELARISTFHDSRQASFNELFVVGALARPMTLQPLLV